MNLAFKACKARLWTGRYSRVQGKESVLHLKTHEGRLWPVIVWNSGDTRLFCAARHSKAVQELADAVAAGKQFLGGSGGGEFCVNEFGQVLVPASDGSGRRAIVGEVSGKLHFIHPEADEAFDLAGDGSLKCGSAWPLPYLGMKYQLHAGSRIYFYRFDEDGGHSEYANPQDKALIASLRKIRRTGAVRIVVNMCGVVLTRRPPDGDWGEEETWQAVFVGRVNFDKWFQKEE